MSKGFGNFQNLLGQAKKMQEKMKELQDQVATKTVEASSGGGMVRAVVNGKQELVSLSIENEIIESRDKQMIQDLVISAVNEGIRQSQQMVQSELSSLAPGFDLGALGKLF